MAVEATSIGFRRDCSEKWLGIAAVLSLGTVLVLAGQNVIRAQSGYPAPKDKYVNDYANVLDRIVIEELRARLQDLDRGRGIEGTVLTIASASDYDVGGQTLEALATRLFNAWGIGNRERNDGFLILVAVDDRMVRIELGKGYGSDLNGEVQRVIDQDMIPALRDGAYGGAIYAGTLSTIATVTKAHDAVFAATRGSAASTWTIVWVVGGIVGFLAGVIGLIAYDSSRYVAGLRKHRRREDGSRRHRDDSGGWKFPDSGSRGGGLYGGGSSSGGGASGKW